MSEFSVGDRVEILFARSWVLGQVVAVGRKIVAVSRIEGYGKDAKLSRQPEKFYADTRCRLGHPYTKALRTLEEANDARLRTKCVSDLLGYKISIANYNPEYWTTDQLVALVRAVKAIRGPYRANVLELLHDLDKAPSLSV